MEAGDGVDAAVRCYRGGHVEAHARRTTWRRRRRRVEVRPGQVGGGVVGRGAGRGRARDQALVAYFLGAVVWGHLDQPGVGDVGASKAAPGIGVVELDRVEVDVAGV